MANDLNKILIQCLARGFLTLRQRVMMTRLVNLDWSMEAKRKGATIDIPISSALVSSDVTPSATPPTPSNNTPGLVQIPLDNWKMVDFHLSDQDLGRIRADRDFIPLQLEEAFKTAAFDINASVYQQYKGVYGWVGTAGTTPFGSGVTIASAVNSRAMLTKQLCPRDNRRAVLDADAESAALLLSEFVDADKRGSASTKTTGDLGTVYGIDWFGDDQIPSHVAGTITTGLAAKAATPQAVGDKTIVCTTAASTGACALKTGDIVTFAGHTQTYTLTADATQASPAADITLNVEPGLATALAGGEAATVKGTHDVNLVFHRDAFALAMRAPDQGLKELMGASIPGGNVVASVTLPDPLTGLIMRLELVRGHKMVIWQLDYMWGTKLVRPAMAIRLAG